MEFATLIVMLALAEYLFFTGRVGAYRGKFKIEAPACTGHDTFERAFRVQQNTIEQLVVFIPATYAFAYFVSAKWVWLPGVMFIAGRLLYSRAYLSRPASRGPGMFATMLANAILVVGTLAVLVMNWV